MRNLLTVFCLFCGTLLGPAVSPVEAEDLKIGGYMQNRYTVVEGDVNSFDVRRLRLEVSGEVARNLGLKVSADFADGSEVKDAYLVFFPDGNISLFVGQMSVPFGREASRSSRIRETPERARFVKAFFGDTRDQGGKIRLQSDGLPIAIELGVFTGAGPNSGDSDSYLDFVGRLQVGMPHEITLGISGYYGHQDVPAFFGTNVAWGESVGSPILDKRNRNRYGFDVFIPTSFGSLRGEYVQARDGAFRAEGWLIQMNMPVSSQTLLVARFDRLADGDLIHSRFDTFTAGVVHDWNDHLRSRLFVERNFEDRNRTSNDALRCDLQMSF